MAANSQDVRPHASALRSPAVEKTAVPPSQARPGAKASVVAASTARAGTVKSRTRSAARAGDGRGRDGGMAVTPLRGEEGDARPAPGYRSRGEFTLRIATSYIAPVEIPGGFARGARGCRRPSALLLAGGRGQFLQVPHRVAVVLLAGRLQPRLGERQGVRPLAQ